MLIIYTDGSYISTSKRGCYGFVNRTDKIVYLSQVFQDTTSQVMEASAFYSALIHSIRQGEDSIIYTDSMYVNKSYNEWIYGWFYICQGKISVRKKLRHNYIWLKTFIIIAMKMSNLSIKVRWVKAHSIDVWNGFIDAIVRKKILDYRR